MNEPIVIRSKDPSDELYHFGVKGMKWGMSLEIENLPIII